MTANYGMLFQGPQPGSGVLSGIQQGMSLANMMQARQQREAELANQAEVDSNLEAFWEAPEDENLFNKLVMSLPRDKAQTLMAIRQNSMTAEGKAMVDQSRKWTMPLASALQAKRPDIFKEEVMKLKDTPGVAEYIKPVVDMLDQDAPLAAENIFKNNLAIVDPESYSRIFGKAGADVRKTLGEAGKLEEETKHLGTKAEADKLAAEAAKISAGNKLTELREGVKKLPPKIAEGVEKYTTAAETSYNLAAESKKIASKVENFIKTSGLKGATWETIKKAAGAEDMETEARTAYKSLRARGAMQNLPPGVASDKDVELATSGWLEPTANPATIASFLRGLEKIQRYEGAQKQARAQFISENMGSGKARSVFEVMGKKSKKGEDFLDFWKRVGNDVGKSEIGFADQAPNTLTLPSGRQLDMSKLTPEQKQKVIERYGRSK